MAISALMQWEVRSGGSDSACSGGFRGGAAISAPSAPTVAGSASGGTVAAGTYYCVVTYTDGLGDTVISGQTSVTTTGTTSSITVTSPPTATNAITWSCYFGTVSGGPYFPQGTGLAIGSNRSVTSTPPTTGTQPLGVDRTLQNAAQVNVDNSTITATTTGAGSNTLTFTGGYTPTGADVGNVFRATGGTNITAGPYEITAVTSTTWTVTGAANLTTGGGAGSAILGVMGGAFATPGGAFAVASNTNGNTVYVKAGTYTILNGAANTAGNKVQVNGSQFLVGYSTNRHHLNTDTAPVFDAGAASMQVLSSNGNFAFINNISITNSASRASVTGWATSPGTGHYRRISVSNCNNSIAGSGTSALIVECSDTGCGGMGALSNFCQFVRYVSKSGTAGKGIVGGSTSTFVECIVTGQASGATVGIEASGQSCVENCVVNAPNTASYVGIHVSGTGTTVDNCIAANATGAGAMGFDGTSPPTGVQFRNCATYNNTIAFKNTILDHQKVNCVALTVDPWANAAGGDFGLNNTAGGGAACRAAGIPGTFPGLSTTGYRAIGAAQAQAAGGGLPHLAGRGGLAG